jgi:hypothetical protein
MHLNKNQQSAFLYRLLGSVKLVGIPRAVEFITKDKNDPQTRYFQIAKNNCTDEEWETLRFAFHKEKNGRIIIDADVEVPPIEEQLGPETKDQGREKKKKKDEAIEILRDLLMRDSSPEDVPAGVIQGEHRDIYLKAWNEARYELGIETFQKEGSHWWRINKKKA